MGYFFGLAARVLLYAPFHRQDSTYHGLWYTSRGALAGTKKERKKREKRNKESKRKKERKNERKNEKLEETTNETEKTNVLFII